MTVKEIIPKISKKIGRQLTNNEIKMLGRACKLYDDNVLLEAIEKTDTRLRTPIVFILWYCRENSGGNIDATNLLNNYLHE